jgi:hypothetical protein
VKSIRLKVEEMTATTTAPVCCAAVDQGEPAGVSLGNSRVSQMRPVGQHRAFDPRRVARLEAATWTAYYRRQWLKVLRNAVSLTRHTFGWSWPSSFYGAWLAMRAIRLWSPRPDNDPEGARRAMKRFYRLVARHHDEPFDSAEAARLEVDWWRIHREVQYGETHDDDGPLVDALARLYAYVYGVPESAVRVAAEQRALAMGYSDQWVSAGCPTASPLLAQGHAALLRSYTELLAAIHV